MESNAQATEIVRDGQIFPAVVCPQCGGRVWPPESLEGHTDRHELRALLMKSQMLPLQKMMRSFKMTSGPWG